MHSCIKSRWVAEKMLWVTAYQEGKNITSIAQSAKVKRDTIYKWLKRYETEGITGLMPKRPGAPTGFHPSRINSKTIDKVVDYYRSYHDGPRQIAAKLKQEGISICHMTAYRHLVAKGWVKPQKKRKRKEAKLHVCDYPGEELQLDVMHVDPLPGTEDPRGKSRQGFHYQYTLVDDCTRIQYADLFSQLSQNNTCLFLEELLDKALFSFNRIRMDNGVEFQTRVKKFLEARKISYIYNRPSRPDQNGKVERAHRTDTQEFYLRSEADNFASRLAGLKQFLLYYNNHRPHWGLGMQGKTPLEKLQSFKEYQTVHLIV
jgi:transposase InsO family protein